MKALILLCFALALSIANNSSCAYIKEHSLDTNTNKEELAIAIENCSLSLQNKDFSKKIYEITNKIRGSNLACAGLSYIDKLRQFQVKLALLMLEPKNYTKQTDTKRDEILKKYFRYWAYQSIGNYRLYMNFWNEYGKILDPLRKYAIKNGINAKESELFSIAAANEFLYWAVGETKIFKDLDEFSLFILDQRNDANQIKAYIYTKQPNKAELIQALQVALLAKKSNSVIKVFIDLGLNINEGYESALFYALESYSNVDFLLKNNANVNYANSFGKTALFYAVEANQKDIAKLLIDNKANVNARYISNNEKLAIINNLGGNTPYYITFCALEHTSKNVLMHAASYADVDMLKLLIESGANLHDVDDLGFNALDFALSAKKMDNAKYLQSLGLKANENLYYGGSLE